MTLPCRHARLEIISQDENGKFLECLDCREIYEAADLDELASKAAERVNDKLRDGVDESSLADA